MLTKKVQEALERALNPYSRDLGGGGNGFSLSKELKVIQKNSQRFFYGAAAMCALIFLLILYLILTNQEDIAYVSAVYSIGGVGLAGLVTLMIKLAKAFTESNLTLVLASRLPTDDVRAVLNALLAGDSSPGSQQLSESKIIETK